MKGIAAFLGVSVLCSFPDACGRGVSGNTYHNNGGVVQVEFKSGGKAYMSDGPTRHTCIYSESGKTVNLVCEGETTNFTMEDDGALVGPPHGLMARLTPVKN
jgi:hypothetical protein